jgi:glutathione reductase (NADPH)
LSSSERVVEADRVVNGAGRIADVDGLDLFTGRVAVDSGQIALDPHLRSTSNTAVYACGDAVATSPQLSPIATYEGRVVGRNIIDGPKHVPDYASIPACVFTVPALASVGLTQAAAVEQGIELRVEVNDMRNWLSARTYAETAAWAKVLIDKQTDRIVGAHILGHAGEELIYFRASDEARHHCRRRQGSSLRFSDFLGRYQVSVVGSGYVILLRTRRRPG